MTLKDRIGSFDQLGKILKRYLEYFPSPGNSMDKNQPFKTDDKVPIQISKIHTTIQEACLINPWFTRENISFAISELARILNQENIHRWLAPWKEEQLSPRNPLRIGVIMAGNIPLVGFHDFISVIISGHIFVGKLSSRDDRLLPLMGDLLTSLNKDYPEMIEFTDEKLSGMDAIIATGSNNTFRYFEYYFGKYPHIFRKNRNSIAVLKGNETKDDYIALGKDIFTYFGLGCRNVSKIFVPGHFSFKNLLDALEEYSFVMEHHKYMNNYMHFKSLYLMNRIPHYDNGFIILKQDNGYHSPIGVLFYEYYTSLDKLVQKLNEDREQLQCITGQEIHGLDTIPFGKTQSPELWDYADNVNSIEFLINLVKKNRP